MRGVSRIRRQRCLALTLVATVWSSYAHAQQAAPDPDLSRASSRDPAIVRRWILEVTSIVHIEAWDYNLFKEELYGGNVALSRELGRGWTASAEATVLYVNQHLREGAWLRGLTFFGRWRFRRFNNERRVQPFLEAGLGASYASRRIPRRGTRFNYLAQSGVGLEARLTSRAALVGGLRWLHLSNASLEGPDHNPDIQAVGAYVGVSARIR